MNGATAIAFSFRKAPLSKHYNRLDALLFLGTLILGTWGFYIASNQALDWLLSAVNGPLKSSGPLHLSEEEVYQFTRLPVAALFVAWVCVVAWGYLRCIRPWIRWGAVARLSMLTPGQKKALWREPNASEFEKQLDAFSKAQAEKQMLSSALKTEVPRAKVTEKRTRL